MATNTVVVLPVWGPGNQVYSHPLPTCSSPVCIFFTWTKRGGNTSENKSIGSKDYKSLEDLKHAH